MGPRGFQVSPRGGWCEVRTMSLYSKKLHIRIYLSKDQTFFFSLLELVFSAAAAQTRAFVDKFNILAGLSRAQKKQSSEFTEFSTKT